MKITTYKQAHKLQEQIAKLKYELEVLQQNYDKPTSVRFGTEYNVSIPIEFDLENYKKCLEVQILMHKIKIGVLTNQFEQL